jgi:hypothetical protein
MRENAVNELIRPVESVKVASPCHSALALARH